MSIVAGAAPGRTIHVEHRNMLVIVIMAGLSAQSIIFTIPTPEVFAIAQHFGGLHAGYVVPLLFALPSLGLMLVGMASGWLLDRLGLRLALLSSMIIYGVMGSLPLLTMVVPAVLVSRFLLGAACATLSTACTMLLVQAYEPAERSRLLGYQSGTGSVAGLLALVIAGLIAGPFGWRAPFGIYFLVTAPLILIAFLSVPKAAGDKPVAVGQTSPGEAEGGALAVLGILWPIYLAVCILFIIPMASSAALPVVLQQRGITHSFAQSMIISPFTIFAAVGAFLFGRVHRRYGSRTTFVLGLVLSGIGMILIGVFDNAPLTAVGEGLAGLGLGFYIPHLWTVAATAPPDHLKSRAVGLMNTAMFLGGFTSPFILGFLNNAFGRAGAFTAIGVIALASVVPMVAARRSILTGSAAALGPAL